MQPTATDSETASAPEFSDAEMTLTRNPGKESVLRGDFTFMRTRSTAAPVGANLPPLPPAAEAPSYQLRRILGRGGFGVVWEGVQGSLRRTVAIKQVRPDRVAETASPEELAALAQACFVVPIEDRRLSAKEFAARLSDFLSGTGKRREAAAILREVGERLDRGEATYEGLGDCIAALGRARALWPGNPEPEALRNKAVARFARIALDHGDFVLARVQADRLDAGAQKAQIADSIDRAERRARDQARSRRVALGAVVVLIAVIAAGSLVFNRRLS